MLRPEFTVRRSGERYDRGQVDALVERILATIGRGGSGPVVTVGDLRTAAFRAPLLGAGYVAEEVDDFLVEAERWLPNQPAAGAAVTGTAPAGHAPAGAAPPGVRRPSPTFSAVKFREGYDCVEVDEFVVRLMATVNGEQVDRPVTAREIRTVQFSPVRLREGYDVQEVDEFLERAEGWLGG